MKPHEIRVWAAVALLAGLAGIAAAFPRVPDQLVALILVAFIGVGPGGVLRSCVRLSPALTGLAVPSFGLSVMLLAATAMSTFALWHPRIGLLVVAVPTVLVATVRLLVSGFRSRKKVVA